MRLRHENILCHTASFCFAANPSASVHDISADIIRKKRGLLYLLPVPALQASRIAHFPKNEQRRSPRRYVLLFFSLYGNRRKEDILNTYPNGHLSLLCLLGNLSLRDFEDPKNKASDKRLSIKCTLPPVSASLNMRHW